MTEIIQTLKTTIAGLGDLNAFEVFFHVNPTTDGLKTTDLLTWTGHSPDTPLTIQEFSAFFSVLTSSNRAPTENMNHLKRVLEQELTDIYVYHIGEAPGQTYIIGKNQEGNFAGLKITSISDLAA